MEKEYYLQDGDERTGPFTYRELVQKGMDVHTQLSTPLNDKWQLASEMPEFIEYFKSRGIHFPTGDNLANFGIKAGAFVIDFLLISIPLDILFVKMGWITIPKNAAMFEMPPQAEMLQLQLYFSVVFLIYNTVLELSDFKGSVGKKICSLVVVNINGEKLSFIQALGRNLGALLSLIVLSGLPFLTMLFNEHRQNWYDSLAKTYIVKTN
ncbi:RDD family protein [Mucilaginibacter sp. HD30]